MITIPTVGWVAIGAGVAVLAISPLVRKLMHLDTLTDADAGAAPSR